MKLPVVSGKKLVSALLKKGYYIKNQKGSHVHLWHPEKKTNNNSKPQNCVQRYYESYFGSDWFEVK